jgi:hypothetical protein
MVEVRKEKQEPYFRVGIDQVRKENRSLPYFDLVRRLLIW